MKKLFNQETIMLLVLCMVVVAVMFGATVAWYIIDTPVSVKNMELQLDDKGDLYVWVQVEENSVNSDGTGSDGTGSDGNGNDSSEEEIVINDIDSAQINDFNKNLRIDDNLFKRIEKINDGEIIDLHMVKQDNIQDQRLAPGQYGYIDFVILSQTDLIKGYNISISLDMKTVDESILTSSHITEENLQALVMSHVKFYEQCIDTEVLEDGTLQSSAEAEYRDVIPYNEKCYYLQSDFNSSADSTIIENLPSEGVAKGILKEGKAHKVRIYWYWPYEYMDIPECLDINNSAGDFYNEFEKYNNIIDKYTISSGGTPSIWDGTGEMPSYIKEELIRAYDMDDTRIGNYVTDLKFHFDVEAIR